MFYVLILLNKKESQGKLDKKSKEKKKQLEDTFEAVVKKKQVLF